MKLIKKIAEALYFKCYPEKKKERELEWTPMPVVIREERADVVNFTAQVNLPMAAILDDKIPSEWIRQELSEKLRRMIEPGIEIRSERDLYSNQVIYTGTIRILRRD